MVGINVSAKITIEITIESEKDFETMKEVSAYLKTSVSAKGISPVANMTLKGIGEAIQKFIDTDN